MLLIIGILFTFGRLSVVNVANQYGQLPAVGECQKDKVVPPINDAEYRCQK
jgi:hypothetical protein